MAIQNIRVAEWLSFGKGVNGVTGFDPENILNRRTSLLLSSEFAMGDGQNRIGVRALSTPVASALKG